jgi:hypothetical protein
VNTNSGFLKKVYQKNKKEKYVCENMENLSFLLLGHLQTKNLPKISNILQRFSKCRRVVA